MTTKQATLPALSAQTISGAECLTSMTDLTQVVESGDFLAYNLVSDTCVVEVVRVTAKTVTLRGTRLDQAAYADDRCDDGSGLPVVWNTVTSDPQAESKTVRLSKDGTLKVGQWARAGLYYRPMRVNGQAVRRVDFRQ